MNQSPIFISGPPRSGTTMLTGLIGKHGVWIGRARSTRHPGTNPVFAAENIDLKNIMKWEADKRFYKNWSVPLLSSQYFAQGTIDKLYAILPEEERFLIQTSWLLIFSDFWSVLFPHAKWVLPYRNPDAIFNSTTRHPAMGRRPSAQRIDFIAALQKRQQQVVKEIGSSIVVDVHKISNYDTEEIARLFNFVDITPHWDTIEEWIIPGRMKG